MTTESKRRPQRKKKESFADRAYRELRRRILENVMTSGQQYTEQDLAALLRMSRTPTREAMLRLANEGLVEIRPRHGMRIKPISVTDMREIYEVLTALESAAAGLAAASAQSEPYLEGMRDAIREMESALAIDDLKGWAKADERFHTLLVASAGNHRLVEQVETFVGQAHRVRMLTLRLRPKPSTSNRDHAELVEAIAAHDADRAREIHRIHRERSGTMLVELLQTHGLTQL